MLCSEDVSELEGNWATSLSPQTIHDLQGRGLTAANLGHVLDRAPGEPVLLTGSYASGEHNPTSDLDILIITQGSVGRLPEVSNHPSIFGDSYDVKVGEVSVNIEYVSEIKVRELAQIANRADRSTPPAVANFQALELRLAHRFVTGVPLLGGETIRAMRAGVHLEEFKRAAVALNFIMAMSLLEDSQVLGSPENFLMVRASAESLCLAALNAFGPITYGIKHIRSRSKKLADAGFNALVLQDVDRMLQIDHMPIVDGQKLIELSADDFLRHLRSTEAHYKIFAMLEPYAATWPKLTALGGTP